VGVLADGILLGLTPPPLMGTGGNGYVTQADLMRFIAKFKGISTEKAEVLMQELDIMKTDRVYRCEAPRAESVLCLKYISSTARLDVQRTNQKLAAAYTDEAVWNVVGFLLIDQSGWLECLRSKTAACANRSLGDVQGRLEPCHGAVVAPKRRERPQLVSRFPPSSLLFGPPCSGRS
jgi:hypothetical protein